MCVCVRIVLPALCLLFECVSFNNATVRVRDEIYDFDMVSLFTDLETTCKYSTSTGKAVLDGAIQ